MSKLVRFARTQGAKDKKKRKSRLLRNIAMGVGGAALLGGGAYLGRGKIAGLMGKGKPKPAATKVPYSQMTKEELNKLTSKQRLELRRNALQKNPSASESMETIKINRDGTNDLSSPERLADARDKMAWQKDSKMFKIPRTDDEINREIQKGINRERGTYRVLRKSRAMRIKDEVAELRKKGAYYQSGLRLTNFRQHKSTMMSLASFNRKWK